MLYGQSQRRGRAHRLTDHMHRPQLKGGDECSKVVGFDIRRVIGSYIRIIVGKVVAPAVGDHPIVLREGDDLRLPPTIVGERSMNKDHRLSSPLVKVMKL